MPVNQTDPRLDDDGDVTQPTSTTEADVDETAEPNPPDTSEPEASPS